MASSPLARLVQMHKAIGHPVRLRILAMLRGGPLCVCQMTGIVRLAASTVSEHLSELRRAGLVAERKEGRWVEYRLGDGVLEGEILEPVWSLVERDAEVRADAVLLKELRRVPLEELCGVDSDPERLDRARVATALERAARLREAGKA